MTNLQAAINALREQMDSMSSEAASYAHTDIERAKKLWAIGDQLVAVMQGLIEADMAYGQSLPRTDISSFDLDDLAVIND